MASLRRSHAQICCFPRPNQHTTSTRSPSGDCRERAAAPPGAAWGAAARSVPPDPPARSAGEVSRSLGQRASHDATDRLWPRKAVRMSCDVRVEPRQIVGLQANTYQFARLTRARSAFVIRT